MPSTLGMVAASLADAGILGICVFDEAGVVKRCVGAARIWAPEPGEHLESAPLFVGLSASLRGLVEGGDPLVLPAVRIAGAEGQGFDIRISAIRGTRLLAAISMDATERLALFQKVEQSARELRMLEAEVLRHKEIIARQAEAMRLFIERVPAAVAMIDGDLNEVFTSEQWRRLYHTCAKGGEKPADASPLREAHRANALRFAIENGVSCARVEKSSRRGVPTWTRWEQTPWRGADGRVAGAFVFSEDITAQYLRMQQLHDETRDLQKANLELRELTRSVAQRLETALQEISTLVDIDAQGGHHAALMRIRLSNMQGMTAALQRYGRLSSRSFTHRSVDLSDAVGQAMEDLRAPIRRSGATVRVSALPKAIGDTKLLALAFRHLVENALLYAGEAPSIYIDAVEDSDGIVVRVTDDGPGIPAPMRPRAFEFFERLGAPESTPGVGMGLAECRKIMELHGGAISLDPDWDAGLRALVAFPPIRRRRTRRPKSVKKPTV